MTQFRPYVFGAKVRILTDHAPLCTLLHRTDLAGRLAKYQIAIMSYDIEIIYRPGKQNLVSDALSRYHENMPAASAVTSLQLLTLDEIQNDQLTSPFHERIKQKLIDRSG